MSGLFEVYLTALGKFQDIMAEGGASEPHKKLETEASTSQADPKLERFLSEPLGNKGVSEIPGLGERHIDRLRTKGIRKAYVILGVFLALNKDKDDFAEWLRKAAATNSSETKIVYRALKRWAEKFI